MAFYNNVILIGNLVRDPDLRSTPGGVAVCDMCIAINHRYSGRDKQEKDEVCFVDIVVWSRQAESCGKYLKKGASVLVEGRLRNDNWEDKEGRKRTRMYVVANSVRFMSLKYDNDNNDRINKNYDEIDDSQDYNDDYNNESKYGDTKDYNDSYNYKDNVS